ncbi:MAG: sugar transferase, partial [Waterburya sp.]
MLDKFSSTPDYRIGKNYLANEIAENRDLRSPGYLKLAEKELSYRLKIVILLVLDSFALWLGWVVAYDDNWQRFSVSFVWQNPEIFSLFLTVLAFMVFLFSAYDLYRKGDKSRNLYS